MIKELGLYTSEHINPLLGKDILQNWNKSFIHKLAEVQQKSWKKQQQQLAELKK